MSLALAALAAALAAAPPPPAPAERPTAAVPIVVDGYGITRGHLRHWADMAARAGERDRGRARAQAAGVLISYRWISGEAAERGIVVTPDEVLQSFREQRDESFPRRREFRRFLRQAGQTRGNILFRVRHDLLSERLREQAVAGATTPEEQQARLEAFVAAFRATWRARTTCLPPWVNEFDCQPTARRRGASTPFARTQFLPSAFAR